MLPQLHSFLSLGFGRDSSSQQEAGNFCVLYFSHIRVHMDWFIVMKISSVTVFVLST
jgi:hypothetical protein